VELQDQSGNGGRDEVNKPIEKKETKGTIKTITKERWRGEKRKLRRSTLMTPKTWQNIN